MQTSALGALRRGGLALVGGLVSLGSLVACEPTSLDTSENDVIVSTRTEQEWAQYVANVRFVNGYEPVCSPSTDSLRPRVLVTGFGRFLDNTENATGRIVSRLVAGLEYPRTSPPSAGEIDEPGAQLRVSQGIVTLPGAGEVEVCALILPVFWDVAAILVAKELDAFQPDLVVMNGIAGQRQPLWLELGAVNRAVALPDGSGTLAPVEEGSTLVEEASPDDHARGNLLSWTSVRTSIEAAIAERAASIGEDGSRFGEVARGVRLAGFPRESNTYLCNNTTYAVGYLMDHPGESIRLLRASDPREGGPDGVDVAVGFGHEDAARVFVHWPSDLVTDEAWLDRAAEVLEALLAAQLTTAEAPSRGEPEMSDLDE